MRLYAILAHDERMGIGKDGGIPWHIPADLAQFRAMTTTRRADEDLPALIMGWTTFRSLPGPLRGRVIITVGRQGSASSLQAAIDLAGPNRPVWVCGGVALYNEVIERPDLAMIHVTQVRGDFGCDRFVSEKYRLRAKHCGKWRHHRMPDGSDSRAYRFGRGYRGFGYV